MKEFLDKMTFEDRLRWEQIQREKRAIALRNDPKIRALVEKRKAEQRQKDAAKPDELTALEATFTKAKPVVEVKAQAKPDNNGWGKERTPEELARVTIDSDLSLHAMHIAPAKQEKPKKEDKRNSRKG